MAADILTFPGTRVRRVGASYRLLLLATTLLTLFVVGLGAYVRLSDAGLGCPDWPGCYGHLVGVPEAPHEQTAAAAAFPGKLVDAGKAWKEMVHRYAAGTLGLLIAALTVSAWRRHRALPGSAPPWLASGLVGLVAFQALLGMWTVTLLLKPVIVTAHLLGGMSTWLILCALLLEEIGGPRTPATASTRAWGSVALAVVFIQAALGGWVSSNYAALACPDLPTCRGLWWPEMDFAHAFTVQRALGETASGALLPASALTAIHWTHRAWAVVVLVIVGRFAWLLHQRPGTRRLGATIAIVLAAQLLLGLANVLLQLPLALAVAHNVGAALLLAATLAGRQRTRKALVAKSP